MQRRQLIQWAGATGLVAMTGSAWSAERAYKVGVNPGPHAQTMEFVQKVAAEKGLKIEIVEFSDFVQPNAALAAGDIDANSFQHLPYLEAQNRDRGYDLVSVAQTMTFPLGIYSRKLQSLDELQEGAKLAIPNDPTNGGRALMLLESQGIIKLKPDAGLKATPLDIAENPRRIKLIELEAAQLPHALDDLDAATINGTYASQAGLNPIKDAIALEAADGPYANIIAVRAKDEGEPWVQELVSAYQSDETRKFVIDNFGDSVIPAW